MSGDTFQHSERAEMDDAVRLARDVLRDIETIDNERKREEFNLFEGKLARAVVGLFEQLEALLVAAQGAQRLIEDLYQSEYAPVKVDWPEADALDAALKQHGRDWTSNPARNPDA